MLLWSGQTVSELGSQLSQVSFPLLVLALTGSPAEAGIVGFARTLPFAILALPAGELADRFDRRRVMVACDAVRTLALLGLALALIAGHVRLALVVAVAFIDGAGFVITHITERGVLRELVPRAQLHDAVAQNESRTFGAMIVGPPLGGLLYGVARALPFLVDALSYLASTLSVLAIRREFQAPRDASLRPRRADGVRWLWRQPFFRACALLAAGLNPIYTGLYLLIVVVAKAHHAGPTLVGVMLAVVAAGGLLGALLAPALQRRLRPRTALAAETLVLLAVTPVLLVAHHPLLLGLVVAAAELLTPTVNAIIAGYRVALSHEHLQGRIQGASTMIAFSAGSLGPLVIGLLLQHAGTTATVLAVWAWVGVLAVLTLMNAGLRNIPSAEPARVLHDTAQ
jgi:MFS family permease